MKRSQTKGKQILTSLMGKTQYCTRSIGIFIIISDVKHKVTTGPSDSSKYNKPALMSVFICFHSLS